MIINAERTDQYFIKGWPVWAGTYTGSVVDPTRLAEKDVYGTLFEQVETALGSAVVYPPELEPDISNVLAWAVVEMDYGDGSARIPTEWEGEGTLAVTMFARLSGGNLYVGKNAAKFLSNALVNETFTITLGGRIIGYVRVYESESYSMGAEHGVLKHGWRAPFQVWNDG